MGLEKGIDQGFLGACLGPQLRAGEAQEEDQDWLQGSGEGLLREREGAISKELGLRSDPTGYSMSRATDPCLS